MLFIPNGNSTGDFIESMSDEEMDEVIDATTLAAQIDQGYREAGIDPGTYGGNSMGTIAVNELLDQDDDVETYVNDWQGH